MKRAKSKPTSRNAVTHCEALPTGVFFTKPEMAQLLKVSLRTLCEMMDRGELPYLKIGGKIVRFRLEDVQRRLTETCLRTGPLDDTATKEAA